MSIVYLLDTNVISEPARLSPNVHLMTKLRLHYNEIAIPSIVAHELLYGVGKMPNGRKKRELEEYVNDLVLDVLEIIPYDKEAAAWHGKERARLERSGFISPFVDGQIAAIAVTRKLTLVTRNTRDFQHFEDIRVENWYQEE